jgi:hypothetical protein
MEWTQAIAVMVSIFTMGIGVILFLTRELRQISRDIHTESKDFHGRMCRLEERYIQLKTKTKCHDNK